MPRTATIKRLLAMAMAMQGERGEDYRGATVKTASILTALPSAPESTMVAPGFRNRFRSVGIGAAQGSARSALARAGALVVK